MTASNFSWEKYLKDTNAVAAPEHLFKEVNLCMFLIACCFCSLVSFIRYCRSKVILDDVYSLDLPFRLWTTFKLTVLNVYHIGHLHLFMTKSANGNFN